MTPEEIVAEVKGFLAKSYADISIEAAPWAKDMSRLALSFRDEKFATLYPQQRYHYLIHNIPDDYMRENLQASVWFELAPGGIRKIGTMPTRNSS